MEKLRPKHVGIWIRVSTEDQAKGESPEHHEKRARYYAESKDWKVKEVYHLEAVSGKSVKDHPETQRISKTSSPATSPVLFSLSLLASHVIPVSFSISPIPSESTTRTSYRFKN